MAQVGNDFEQFIYMGKQTIFHYFFHSKYNKESDLVNISQVYNYMIFLKKIKDVHDICIVFTNYNNDLSVDHVTIIRHQNHTNPIIINNLKFTYFNLFLDLLEQNKTRLIIRYYNQPPNKMDSLEVYMKRVNFIMNVDIMEKDVNDVVIFKNKTEYETCKPIK